MFSSSQFFFQILLFRFVPVSIPFLCTYFIRKCNKASVTTYTCYDLFLTLVLSRYCSVFVFFGIIHAMRATRRRKEQISGSPGGAERGWQRGRRRWRGLIFPFQYTASGHHTPFFRAIFDFVIFCFLCHGQHFLWKANKGLTLVFALLRSARSLAAFLIFFDLVCSRNLAQVNDDFS